MIWKTSALTFVPAFAPHAVAALLTGLTLARALDRRSHAVALAVTGMVLWIGIELVAFVVYDTTPRWSAPITSSAFAHFGLVALLCVPAAALAASLRLRGRPDHRLLWLWISALVTLGTIIASLTLITKNQLLPPIGVILILVAPIAAGAITQVLSPFRMIWTCGGGALIFVLIMLDKGFRTGDIEDGIAGPLLGMGMFILLGALGARIGWRVFRNQDPYEGVELPTASVQGDV